MQLDRQLPILVTGAAGRIGRGVVAALVSAGWRVRGFDLRPSRLATESLIADLADTAAVAKACSGTGAVIHLGGVPDDEDFLTRLLPSNIVGTYNVLEGARAGGVTRMLVASSGQVQWWQQKGGPWPVHAHDPYTPRHWYAAGKIFLEAAAMGYGHDFGMTVLALRLGWCPRNQQHIDEVASTPVGPDIYMSPADAGRFCVRAIEADLKPGFSVMYVASRPVKNTVLDLSVAKQLLGWEPTDQWPTGATEGMEA